MSYIALARKWRPRTFSQLVGQEHVTRALTHSLNQNRLHHAYLFTGTRGVGKTSVARLLAKALNCEQGIQAHPCLQCDSCLAIEQGRFIDLIEIDGASKTRIEDTRDMLENVQYTPAHGRFKVYLIDEVHMLSQHSFNALLKTLEEPPEYVKFLLATTDPQKLPITVLSRCLQFTLRPITDALIVQQLALILESEQITFEQQALQVLAKAASGSMRDALSLLDQALAGCDQMLHTAEVKALLGYTKQDYALKLIKTLLEDNPLGLLSISREIAEQGGQFHYVLDELMSYLHQLAICKSLPGNNPHLPSSPDIQQLSTQFEAEDLQLLYQIALKGSQELHLAPTVTVGFEMTLLRLHTFKPAARVSLTTVSHTTLKPDTDNNSKLDLTADAATAKQQNTCESVKTVDADQTNPDQETSLQPEDLASPVSWTQLLTKLQLKGLSLTAAENAEFVEKSGANIVLVIAKTHRSLVTDKVVKRIEQALSHYYKEDIKLTVHQKEELQTTPAQQKESVRQQQAEKAESSIKNDLFFQKLQQEFSAELVKNSIKPLHDDI